MTVNSSLFGNVCEFAFAAGGEFSSLVRQEIPARVHLETTEVTSEAGKFRSSKSMKAAMLSSKLTGPDQGRFANSSRRLLRHRLKIMKLKEYQKLRTMVPCIASKPYVSKVTVIEEAVKYIDQLHAAVVMKLRTKQLPVEMLSNTTKNLLKVSLAKADMKQGTSHCSSPAPPAKGDHYLPKSIQQAMKPMTQNSDPRNGEQRNCQCGSRRNFMASKNNGLDGYGCSARDCFGQNCPARTHRKHL